ncbi:MAG TPA: hypothetical protein VGR21_12735 [Cryptosporangiaceae bacterium]|nr:hypothetical protein [Cryptosporangiaceae bacterium]
MLEARKTSVWKNTYEITADGRPLARWDGSVWKAGGQFELDGQRYQVRGNMWGSKYGMVTEDGTPVAAAERVGRKRWTVEADGRTYEFQRASIWRNEQQLLVAGQPVGSVKRKSMWRNDAVADLPGLPVPVQVFVLAVVLPMWDWDDATAALGGGAAAAGATAAS